jgi:hypothetical protein
MITFYDRIKETTTTTGTGNIVLLGASPQYLSFASRYTANNQNDSFYYCIAAQAGTEFEIGLGNLATANTIARSVVTASSNSDQLVNFSAGTKDVYVTLAANYIQDDFGLEVASAAGYNLP